MAGGVIVPPGQSPPFATVTKDDHAAGIIIATFLGIALTTLILLVRVFIRKNVNFGWQWDDTTALLATILGWVQSTLVLVACADGLGKSLKIIPIHLRGRVQQLYYASNLLYVCAIHLSRISVMLFILRLTAHDTALRKYAQSMLGVVAASMIAFLFAAAFQCSVSQPWNIVDQKCTEWFTMWEAQAVVASLTEVAIFIMPVWLVWRLQKSISIRLEIVLWFGSRLLVIIFTGTRMQSFNKSGFNIDPFLRESTYICLTQAELSYSIIAATIPAARTLVTDLITYYNGGGFGSMSSNPGGSRSGDTYQMRSLKSASKAASKRQSEHVHWDRRQPQAEDGDADGDADSQELIIRKDTVIHISRENQK